MRNIPLKAFAKSPLKTLEGPHYEHHPEARPTVANPSTHFRHDHIKTHHTAEKLLKKKTPKVPSSLVGAKGKKLVGSKGNASQIKRAKVEK